MFNQHDEDIKTVLTDMKMPGMNGTTLLRTLRATNPNVRLVATSGVNTAGLAQEALAAGATEFVAKPYTTLDLLRALSNS
ncbi:response regulator transcription factor [Ornithinimicrobium sp. INDO-MA30-4]|uniref:response regulator transcription factor n=1 Tax=Ornithinimicrobium sp. INDO-MA30-4 TaxID=2908651 RepID=UPI001F4195ED|nr:response regulator [Ornithinimicrobium sp. INDO-MA30-4]UJH70755.1 response regulator [Ornithinimicrobium sp. INDO-MA30-4]